MTNEPTLRCPKCHMSASYGQASSPDRIADTDEYYCLLCHRISDGDAVRRPPASQKMTVLLKLPLDVAISLTESGCYRALTLTVRAESRQALTEELRTLYNELRTKGPI